MYQKLGGKEAIKGVVDEFYTRVFADDEVKNFFEGINKRKLKAHQVDNPATLRAELVHSNHVEQATAIYICGFVDSTIVQISCCLQNNIMYTGSLTSWQLMVFNAVLVSEQRHAS